MYAGRGSSHSWTWTADLLESRGVLGCRFVDADGLARGLEEGASLVVVSGGDGFEIASALAPRCFAAVEGHIRGGGLYMGVCAGAYLPLPSRVEPFDGFNLSTTRIRNIAGREDATAASPRTGVRYGSCSIVHPVRGEVEVGDGSSSFRAPVYGGPVFHEPEADAVLLRYSSFTPRTVFQVGRVAAEEMVIGSPAVVSSRLGEGTMVLAGPHLEHPAYPQANEAFARLAGLSGAAGAGPRGSGKVRATELDRPLADLRVAVLGMERETFLVGAKLWDGGRMLELADAVAKRRGSLGPEAARRVAGLLDRAREELLSLGPERTSSDSAPSLLVEAARLCVDSHFESLRDDFILAHPHSSRHA